MFLFVKKQQRTIINIFKNNARIKSTDNGPYRETQKVSAVERCQLFKFSVLHDLLSVQKPYAMQQ